MVVCMFSCKKETVYIEIDAFKDLRSEFKYNDGQYHLEFSLAKYPYKEVGVLLSENKNDFFNKSGYQTYKCDLISENRYAARFFPLTSGKRYYYQIYVTEGIDKKIMSDVFTLETLPQ